MDKLEYRESWLTEYQRLWASVADGDLSRPVPSCPEWRLRDLIAHVELGMDRYALRLRSPSPPGRQDSASEVPDPRPGLERAAAGRAAALTSHELDDVAWNWSPLPNTARFWFRRAGCELAIHRWDAQTVGGGMEPIDRRLAVEGITEVLDSFLPVGRRVPGEKRTGRIRMTAVDAEVDWAVTWDNGQYSMGNGAEGSVDAEISGTASDIFLALWGRIPPTTLDLQDDSGLVDTLRAK